MVNVEAEAANLQRLAAALVLASVDAGVESVEDLVVAQEQPLAVDRVVAPLDAGVNHR